MKTCLWEPVALLSANFPLKKCTPSPCKPDFEKLHFYHMFLCRDAALLWLALECPAALSHVSLPLRGYIQKESLSLDFLKAKEAIKCNVLALF